MENWDDYWMWFWIAAVLIDVYRRIDSAVTEVNEHFYRFEQELRKELIIELYEEDAE